ncbi:alpha/beta hydrolase [Rhodobacteraceae bacterium 2376]|uniref:Alpha/beta hydrolase n=1 Tax=Rhabdonatronobacter sediminivivens TaxID=2743469 RepID=A0A7Z0HYP9_9RHOB|nr:alpha/beta hydrolase [Rhabdonatronobacter sediminivivens]NYS24751.1 alpha/beta hydrolase [Rhabdonatronobacter sediminivivens]
MADGTDANSREGRARQATPPEGQFVEVNGRRVHAVVRGQGPDLVLIHGASGNARDFTFDMVEDLADDFRVIAFDRPGMGWSDRQEEIERSPQAQADVLRSAAAQLGVERPIVLGHSYGGAVALGWALRDPGNTAALVLLAPASHPWPGDLGFWYRVTASPVGRWLVLPAVSAFAPQGRAEDVIERIFAPDPVPEGYTDHVGLDLALRRSQLAVNAIQVNALRVHVEAMVDHYPQLTLPVEILHGTADTTVGMSIHSERLAAEVPGANLVRLEGVGHMPHHARRAETLDAIARAATRTGLR